MCPSAVHCLIFGELFLDAIDIRRTDVYNKIVNMAGDVRK